MRLLRVLMLMLFALAAFANAAPPTFAPVTPGRALQFPLDFGAHPEHRTEWWYVTGWLDGPDGKPLGFQVTFFRSRTGHDPANPSAFAPKQLIIGHAALSDPASGRLVHDQRSAREGFGLAWAKTGDTDVKLDEWSMRRGADGRYRVSVRGAELAFALELAPTQPVLAQGEAGFSQKGPKREHASYYYSEPHLAVSGTVTRAGKQLAVKGTAWLDHEWSSQVLEANAAGWDWAGINLADGGALWPSRSVRKTAASCGPMPPCATVPAASHSTARPRWRSRRARTGNPRAPAPLIRWPPRSPPVRCAGSSIRCSRTRNSTRAARPAPCTGKAR